VPELVTLAAAVTTTRSTVRVTRVDLDVEAKRITVEWATNLSTEAFSKVYDSTTNPTGAVLLTSLNTANLTTTSLVKRVIQRLQTDGLIAAGSIAGSPD
jgi:hypothetical protein